MRCAASRLARFGYLIVVCAVFCGFSFPLNVARAEEQPAENSDVNRIVSVTVDADEKNPKVNIRTENPVGYRYTVYDTTDPARVVIDFPRMDVSDIESPLPVDVGPIQEIRAVSFDLTLGKLGRIEVLVDRKTDYRVKIDGNDFVMTFAEPSAPVEAPAAPQQVEKTEKTDKTEPVARQDSVSLRAPAPAPALADAVQVTAVEIRDGRAAILTNGPIDKYRYFNLSTPPRLVLDIFGVKPSFRERELPGARGFDRVRVGTYDDKTRFVFDAGGSDLPSYEVSPADEGLMVTWTPDERVPMAEQPSPEPEIEMVESTREPQAAQSRPEPVAAPTEEPEPKSEPVVSSEPEVGENDAPKAEPKPVSARQVAEVEVNAKPAPVTERMTQAPVQVEDISFAIEGDLSVLTVDLSAPAQVSNPIKRGNVVLFGLDHATIKRSLRRVIDTSAFPSALEMITPYTVNRGTVQDVRFAARLKGDVPYRLKQRGDQLIFEVENGEFAKTGEAAAQIELKGAQSSTRVVAAHAPVPAIDSGEKTAPKSLATQALFGEESQVSAPSYSGDRISLVFDNADVRNLLQLIAEVSDLNIIASEEVSGNVSIRLIDVPWDQALDVILDIKQLGMIREGNVVRILPKSKIREMEEAVLTAARNKSELEPLVTRVFSVSYTDLANVAAPLRDVMSERGRLTQDPRNKQIIVKDTPSVMEEIEGLVEILDTPERQVMIEARIVEASSDFTRDLGVNWGISSASNLDPGINRESFNAGIGGNFLVNLPTAGDPSTTAGLGVRFGEILIDNTVIDLRLSALESSGHGKIISRPRVSTLNGQEAVITQGTTIPYQTSGADGPKTEFVDATLELKVIPVINPDNSIIMEIEASNSTPGQTFTNADLPGINKKEAKTKVLVYDGDTTVLGGIFVEDDSETESGVPWLMNVPFLGRFFKSTNVEKRRSELLIFITPRILE
ncbi:type IV pilus secretin PilQ [Geoalkalibacter subterraneus]|uniref:Secretin/TonB short N-terminal domain-containing protein n=1 Tax=Geoalkalibacter subterraneus TaxID=483547 RepID=A0A0B5FFK6_9BACT|nr:type IV pilus secretin PilQ [Geoalkalibacter subterraneus]AJF06058.1 hypothetical protein GSUB_05070 [Geoalkalibacter subterraneus]